MKIMHEIAQFLSRLPPVAWYILGALVTVFILLALVRRRSQEDIIRSDMEAFLLECDKRVHTTTSFCHTFLGKEPERSRLRASVRFFKFGMDIWLEYTHKATPEDLKYARYLHACLRQKNYTCHLDGPVDFVDFVPKELAPDSLMKDVSPAK